MHWGRGCCARATVPAAVASNFGSALPRHAAAPPKARLSILLAACQIRVFSFARLARRQGAAPAGRHPPDTAAETHRGRPCRRRPAPHSGAACRQMASLTAFFGRMSLTASSFHGDALQQRRMQARTSYLGSLPIRLPSKSRTFEQSASSSSHAPLVACFLQAPASARLSAPLTIEVRYFWRDPRVTDLSFGTTLRRRPFRMAGQAEVGAHSDEREDRQAHHGEDLPQEGR